MEGLKEGMHNELCATGSDVLVGVLVQDVGEEGIRPRADQKDVRISLMILAGV